MTVFRKERNHFNVNRNKISAMLGRVIALVLVFVFTIPPFSDTNNYFVNAESTELENRPCITYPNNTTPYIEQVFDTNNWKQSKVSLLNDWQHTFIIPGNPNGNSNAGWVGGISASQKVDILNNDFSVTYSMTHYYFSNLMLTGRDYGNAFTIYNDDNHYNNTHSDQDYGALGLYRKTTYTTGRAPNNSLAVEFDPYNWTGSVMDDGRLDRVSGLGDNHNGPHIAITEPNLTNSSLSSLPGSTLPHDSLSVVEAGRFSDGQWGTARVEWFLLDPGNTNSYTDNIYRFKYSYWYSQYAKGDGSYDTNRTDDPITSRAPDLTGYRDFSFAQMAQKFGYSQSVTSMPVTMAITGSTGSLVNVASWFRFPSTYPYTVNYYVREADGTLTVNRISEITPNPVSGRVVEGPISVEIPEVPNYTFHPGSSDSLTPMVTATGTNVFNYYYTENILNYSIEYYHDGVLFETVSGSVPENSPNITSVATTNKPEGSSIGGYEFPSGISAEAPSAANPYTITAVNNVIKVYYKTNIIESPNAAVSADTDYVLISFDANDLNNDAADEEVRGRLQSKMQGSTLTDQETITYAVFKGTKWKDFASVAATPTLELKSANWLFDEGINNYVPNSWKDARVPVGTTMTIPVYNSEEVVESIFLGSPERHKTYYAQYSENTPTGILVSHKTIPIYLLFAALLLIEIVLVSTIIRRKQYHD